MNTTPIELQIRDIHLPDPVSFWPLAPGWWILGIVLVLLIILIVALMRFYKRRQIQRLALQQLQDVEAKFRQEKDKRKLVAELSVLLRRICLSYYPRQESAQLTGETWLQFLDNMVGETVFQTEHGKVIATAPYQAQADFDAEKLLSQCSKWVKRLPAHATQVSS